MSPESGAPDEATVTRLPAARVQPAFGGGGGGGGGGRRRGLDMVEALGAFRRRLKLFLIVVVLAMVGCIGAILLSTPQYTATVELKIDPNQRSVVEDAAPARSDNVNSAMVDTELQVARSRNVAEGVVKNLNLIRDDEFAPEAQAHGAPVTPEVMRDTVGNVLDNLDVTRKGLTYMVEVRFTSKNAKKASTIANAFAREYLYASVRMRNDAMEAQADNLQDAQLKLEQEAKEADAAAASYRAGAGLVNASSGNTVTQQQATTIAGQLSAAEADLAEARANLNAARQQAGAGDAGAVGSVLASPVIQNLRSQRADVVARQGQIASRYGPRHPDVLAVQQQLDDIDRQLADERTRVLTSLEVAENAAQGRVASLRNMLGGLQGRLNSASRAESVAQSLEREAQAKQNIYNQYNLAQQQANQQKNLDQPAALIVSPAAVPQSPSFPNKPLFGVLGIVASIVLGLSAVLLAETFDSRVTSGRDVETALKQPFIASIPVLNSRMLKKAGKKIAPESYVIAKPMSAFAESFRSIRSALMLSSGARAKVVAFTSALPGEGKTSASLAFGRVLGMGGAKVIVVDCDIRRGALGGVARTSTTQGLLEVLAGEVQLPEAMIEDRVENVFLLPLSKATASPKDLFTGEPFRQLIAKLRATFDFVIIDTPPVLAVADARTLARQADCVLFLVRWLSTPRAAAQAALSMLEQDNATIAGVALNMVDFQAKAYLAEGDSSYYYAKYRKYYQS